MMTEASATHFATVPLFLLLSLMSLPESECFPQFIDKIPNGGVVPNPYVNQSGSAPPGAPDGQFWAAIGHLAASGGGPRNKFGIDFGNLGKTWTRELCLLDSDGDGRSNGAELGDPQCTWKQGQTPDNVTGITHPGVCDPIGSPLCILASLRVPEVQPASANATSPRNLTPGGSEPNGTSTDRQDAGSQRARRPGAGRVRLQQGAASERNSTSTVTTTVATIIKTP